ncbi:DUF6199 family natural product biosynthesis protein [Clostridium thermosuccinogenes]|jgi:hypothetical protein|uniref:DUF6199 family natural product biosynthesis protein n=1 Tax=Clostridium thermosuccinogenes TaxID=84032 RepID=UPI003BEF136D
MLLMLFSLKLLFFPRQLWNVAEEWKNSEAVTPSKAYVIALRCIGIVFLITGFTVFIKL